MSDSTGTPADPAGTSGLAVLQRIMGAGRRRPPGEQCEMCAEAISGQHSHVVNLDHRSLMCVCRGCWLLFTHEGAARGRYRAVPDRYLVDPAFPLSDAHWDALQIPVRMAFFFFNSTLDQVVAFYPSPGGATESLLPAESWQEVLGANPALSDITPDVEALLVRRGQDGFECYLAPIDACYELVGRVKLHWKGFDGGEEVWSQIDQFFSDLRGRSQVVATPRPDADPAGSSAGRRSDGLLPDPAGSPAGRRSDGLQPDPADQG